MALEVFAVLGRLWVIFLACFQSAKAPSSTILPLVSKPPANPRPSRSQVGQAEPSNKAVEPQAFERWREQKQEFLRHPSLRRSNDLIFDKGKRKEKVDCVTHPRPRPHLPPSSKIQDSSYIPAPDVRPPRPPRPPSMSVPSVIVTPCTPTIPVLPELSSSIPQLASLEHEEQGRTSDWNSTPGEIIIEPPEEDVSDSYASFHLSTSSQFLPEHDIAELKVDDFDNPFRVPDSQMPTETPRRSFNIPQTLKTISFGPLRYTNNALSAVSDMLWDDASWIYQTSPTDRLAARANSYVTSTPARKRLATTIDPEVAGRRAYGSPFSDSSSPRSLHLPDEQMDLLPYPDVFDLDMYYGLEPNRLSIPHPTQAASARKRQSLKKTNRISSSSASATPTPTPTTWTSKSTTESPKSERRFGFLPDACSVQKSFSVEVQQVKRYRDHYRHPAYTCPPHVASDTSIDSLGEAKLKATKEARVLRPASSLTLNKASPQAPTAFRSDKPTIQTKEVHCPSIPKERGVYPSPPIVVVSHHRFGSLLSEPSQSTGCEDSDELRARLREACHNFSKPVWTDEACSLEAVSLS